jgi:hypothetical protein
MWHKSTSAYVAIQMARFVALKAIELFTGLTYSINHSVSRCTLSDRISDNCHNKYYYNKYEGPNSIAHDNTAIFISPFLFCGSFSIFLFKSSHLPCVVLLPHSEAYLNHKYKERKYLKYYSG